MAYAPAYAGGRQLSPGEVYEDPTQEPQQEEEWREDLNVLLICPDCKENPPNLVEEFSSGDTVCASCGRVLADRTIDTRSEWRTFSNDDQGNDDPSRVGDAANPLLHGSQLQTEIGFGDGGLRVRELARAQNKSNLDKTNKNLQAAYGQISTLCESASIPKVVGDTTKMLYKKAHDAKLFKGKSQDAIIAGCVVIACRQHKVGRSFREVFKLTSVTKKEIGRTFKHLETFLYKEIDRDRAKAAKTGQVSSMLSFEATTSTGATALIGRACNKLNLPTNVSLIAQECAAKVSSLGIAAGRSPLSITGACIYLVAQLMGHSRTPKQITEAVDVSDGTIRTSYKIILADIDSVLEQSWLERGGKRELLPAS